MNQCTSFLNKWWMLWVRNISITSKQKIGTEWKTNDQTHTDCLRRYNPLAQRESKTTGPLQTSLAEVLWVSPQGNAIRFIVPVRFCPEQKLLQQFHSEISYCHNILMNKQVERFIMYAQITFFVHTCTHTQTHTPCFQMSINNYF